MPGTHISFHSFYALANIVFERPESALTGDFYILEEVGVLVYLGRVAYHIKFDTVDAEGRDIYHAIHHKIAVYNPKLCAADVHTRDFQVFVDDHGSWDFCDMAVRLVVHKSIHELLGDLQMSRVLSRHELCPSNF
jgi:hypothetical protein